ncbi:MULTISPECIES: hypothetical protein [unclassified Tychonema]|uniref:hypothetical protein n=1 Tax=unclassified Tychonema TaxID=2642144 RepID=UPI00187E57FB|nr:MULTISPECIES: hypothetical protein [unclassified Tychonema]MBE9095250.1 hypothetical protein [Tychonema sp. LEGE 07203]MBE9122434.1 hypothetical protein [Tychonema sp. LEGE 07199]MBE9135382.1 hypothetical protein [Tychonema sp. LEGE 07196]
MRPENSVWQGNFGYWQQGFIHTNLLVIGYTGWKGFESFGRGVVVCDVDTQVLDSTMTSLESIPFHIQFIPINLMEFYLRSLSVDSSNIPFVIAATAKYNPEQDILLLLKFGRQTEVNLLSKLAIPPADCYEQVCRRWEEFQPSLTP